MTTGGPKRHSVGMSLTPRHAFESDLVAWLAERFPATSVNPLGLSDDAAMLDLAATGSPTFGSPIVTSDLLADGVHFDSSEPRHTPAAIGYKALAVNLSDLAAMAAAPAAFLVSLLIPRGWSLADVQHLYDGMMPLVKTYGLSLAGGDTNRWEGMLTITVTAVGTCGAKGPLTRRGARPGDVLMVTGRLGGSRLGRHLAFTPRVATSLYLREKYDLHAGMDISDGLALDAWRMARASGVGFQFDLDRIPISEDAIRVAESTQRTPLEHALSDGEDFELLLSASREESARMLQDESVPDVRLTAIGQVIAQGGLWQCSANRQERRPLLPTGYQHA